MYVCTSSRAHGRKCACVEIKEHADEISTCAEEDWFHLFYQLSCNPASDLRAAENFIMDPVEPDQNHGHSLRNTKECVRRQENGKQARRQTSLRSRRQQESAEQLEQWRKAGNES